MAMTSLLHDLLYGSGALATWIAFGYKIRHLPRTWPYAESRALCAALGFCAVGFTLTAGVVYRPVDALLGVPNLAKLWSHGAAVLFSINVLRMLTFWSRPAEEARRIARYQLLAALTALGCMAFLILSAPIHHAYTEDFWLRFSGGPYMFTYLVIFLSVLGFSLICVTRHARRYARDVHNNPWLGRGLRTTAVGAAVFFGYCLLRGMYLLGLCAGANLSLLVYAAQPCAAFGSIIFVAGLTMPGWGRHASGVHTWLRAYRDHRRLYPLWRALYSAFPEIALDPPSTRTRWKEFSPRDIPYRLYRRVVEIQDGCRALRPHLAPHPPDTAASRGCSAGQSGKEPTAVAEAIRITHGLRAKERGHSYPQETATNDFFGRDLEDEIVRLGAISQALNSPLVKNDPAHSPADFAHEEQS